MLRRDFLLRAGAGLGLAAMSGCETPAGGPESAAEEGVVSTTAAGECPETIGTGLSLPRVRADAERIIAITACVRPFRPQGPRVETERLGRKTIVHNYGHGGCGWSLSWGSSTLALTQVLATGVRDVAVIGCGILGLTSALLAQRAGLRVRIYAKDRPPNVRSALATGNWSPGSRFCAQEHATPEVVQRWETMARTSYRTYQNMLGLPGHPIEWRDGYSVRDEVSDTALQPLHTREPEYAALEHRIRDLMPRSQVLPPGTHPFRAPHVFRYTNMIFNLTAYMHLLVSDFLALGGEIETREFGSPGELEKLPEKTLINATGYGARALFGDESIIPVRGQLLRLIPQPEVTYGLVYNRSLFMVPRRDGIVLQTTEGDDFGNEDTAPDPAIAERAIKMLAQLNERMCG